MADLSRGTRWYDVRLSGREVSGIVAGSLLMLCLAFALGVGFGKRLATPTAIPKSVERTDKPTPPTPPRDFTYQQELTKPEPPPAPPPKVATARQAAPPPVAPPPANAAKPVETPAPKPEPAEIAESPKAAAPSTEPAAPEPFDEKPVNPEEDQFAVQFRAFNNGADAAALARELTGDGYDAYVKVVDIPKKGRFYRVRAGHFRTREAADQFQRKAAREHHLDSTVMPSN